MNKQYFNCHDNAKHYFNNPDFNTPCYCSTASMKKALDFLMSYINLGIYFVYFYGEEDSYITSNGLAELNGNVLSFISVSDNTPTAMSVCSLRMIALYINPGNVNYLNEFLNLFKKYYPEINNFPSECCCNKDVINIFKGNLGNLGNPDYYSIFINAGDMGTHISARLIAYDGQVAWLQSEDSDYTFYLIPIVYISAIQASTPAP